MGKGLKEEVNGGKHIIFRVKSCLGGGQSELEELVNFSNEAKIFAVDGFEGHGIEVAAVEAQVFEEEQAAEHVIAFSAVGPGVKAWDGALATDDMGDAIGNNPSCGALEVVSGAVTHKSSVVSCREGGIDVKWGLVSKVNTLEKHPFPRIEGKEVFEPSLAEDDRLFSRGRREE